ncbi:MAG: hypothetical protein EXS09_03615 [Gemmataceae bacterium]|nr:hypothetical protein [Gemmataceae bacterium]
MTVPLLVLTKEERLFLWIGILLAVLVVGGMLIGRLDRWRKRQMEEEDETSNHVGSFRALYEKGAISKKEYDRVLRGVAERAGMNIKPENKTAIVPQADDPPKTEDPPSTPVV